MDRVRVIRTDETYVKKFRLYGFRSVFKFNRPPAGVSELDWIREGFKDIVEQMKDASTSDSDYLGFTLRSLNFKNKEPGYIAFRPASELDSDIVWAIFGGIVQSNSESITSSDTFQIECTRVNLPVGSGIVRPGLYNNFDEECLARKGIVTIKNKDNLCLPRAIVVAKAHAKKDPLYKAIRQDKGRRQTLKTQKLIAKARLVIPEEGAGIPELEKIQDHLRKYHITVYKYGTRGRDVYYSGNNQETSQYRLNLLYNNGHFNVITNLTAAFACKFFCAKCHTPYQNRGEHRCSSLCSSCLTISPPCKLEPNGVLCPDCNRHFKNMVCFVTHQREVCPAIKKCMECDRVIFLKKRNTPHVCGEVYCSVCSKFMSPNHQCFMRVDTSRPITKDFLYVFFDLETRQDERSLEDPDAYIHKVNLCVSQQYCWQCIDGILGCEKCAVRTRVFKGQEPVREFMRYVMSVRKDFKSVCVIAHNGQGFDFQFVLRYILEETQFTPELITRGSKVILLELDNVRFIDSLNYFPMALSTLPKAFGLPPEKKKGYFPHLFNTVQNQNYVGPMPPAESYCPDTTFKKSKDKELFERWYADQVRNGYIFDFQKEIVEYCISDVDILAQACITFRALFLEQCNLDPFLEAVTIASACNLAFRRNFLKTETIGLVPKKGYRLVDIQSPVALQWLSLEEEQRGVRIKHAGREREVKVKGVRVDGFDGVRVYEFHGCYFHGCPKCFPYKREESLKEDPSDSLHQRYERTKVKIEKLKTSHEVVEMWECVFKDKKKRENLSYLENLPILNSFPLNPRDAFFGGRTGNAKTYHKCRDGEQIHYVDVCSLYPYVCKYSKYPLGHPTVYVGDEECRSRGMKAEGLLKCKVLPPTDLLHPVLPTRMHGKLMFLLCRRCGEELRQEDCPHDDENRCLVGTWTMDEVRKAVEKGYVIQDMYELWEYTMATFEDGGLFCDFINKFLKLKQEASGYPSWCHSDEDRVRYVEDYFSHEGIQLDQSGIKKNEGLRSLAKLMLNSFWGKFGQRENQTKTIIMREPQEFFKLISNPAVQVNRLQEINEEVLLVNWQNIEEVGETLRTVNVVLAAYTTSHARLKLYEHLEALGEQVLYYDTDSVVYLYENGLCRVNTGDYLGQMTNELEEYGPGSYIVEFVSGGPKTYAYLVWSTEKNCLVSVCKIKGLTLNLKTSQTLDFQKLKEMVLSEVKETIEVSEKRIRRTKEKNVITANETKVFKITGPKRRFEGEYDTLPYGFKKRRC